MSRLNKTNVELRKRMSKLNKTNVEVAKRMSKLNKTNVEVAKRMSKLNKTNVEVAKRMSWLNERNVEFEKRRWYTKTTIKLNFDRKHAPYCCVVSLRIFTRCLYFDSPYGLAKIRHNS